MIYCGPYDESDDRSLMISVPIVPVVDQQTLHAKNIAALAKSLPGIPVFEMPIGTNIADQDLIAHFKNMTLVQRKALNIGKTLYFYLKHQIEKGMSVKVYSKAKQKLSKIID